MDSIYFNFFVSLSKKKTENLQVFNLSSALFCSYLQVNIYLYFNKIHVKKLSNNKKIWTRNGAQMWNIIKCTEKN
jgi:hypothetical protein